MIYCKKFKHTFQCEGQCILVIVSIHNTVNVLKFRTLKNNYFSAVRNFRNYVSEKSASVRSFRMWYLS